MSVKIRLASKNDAPQILEIYSPIVNSTHISFEHEVPDIRDIAARIAATLKQYPWLVCEIDSCIVGYAYASAFRGRKAYQWTTETTVYVHEAFRRRGVSRALYSTLLAILRQQGYRTALASLPCQTLPVSGLTSHWDFERSVSSRVPASKPASGAIQAGGNLT